MALWSERVEAVAIPVSDFVEHFFAFADGKPLALNIIG